MKTTPRIGKFLALTLHCITLVAFCQAQAVSAASSTSQNFYFDSFSADYYLTRASDGTSSLHVEETFIAVFPDTDQNHGIVRVIPTTNQDGKNFTMDPKTISIDVFRNDERETVDRVEGDDSYHTVYIGSADSYVHGRQEYLLRYGFTNVITQPGNVQELYWDTNGTGFSQRFDSLTARVHLDQSSLAGWTGDAWCYVGRQGSSDQSRCSWEKTGDSTIEFTVSGPLSAGENLTFDLTLEDGTFVVPEPPQDFTPIFATLAIVILSIAFVAVMLAIYGKHRPRYKAWRATFIVPEYQPPKNLTVAEACLLSTSASAQLSLPATLIELAISSKIKLEESKTKVLKKSRWHIRVVSITGLSKDQLDALRIVNAGTPVAKDDLIEIKSRTATSSITAAHKSYKEDTEDSLESKKLFQKSKLGGVILVPILYFVLSVILAALASDEKYGSEVIAPDLPIFAMMVVFFLFFWGVWLGIRIGKVSRRTDEGLKTERRLEGLKMFIKLTETDRIEFFQSAKSADRIDTKDGKAMVRLYEKLLPYAIIFGLEKSWSRELETHYENNPSYAPAWYIGTRAFSATAFASELHSFTASVSSTSSSSSSGASGGGFSGGGGGGGGGGGW